MGCCVVTRAVPRGRIDMMVRGGATTRRELRQFGLGLSALVLLLGLFCHWKGAPWAPALYVLALVFGLAFWFELPGVKQLYLSWMKLAGIMARVMTFILLTLIYVMVVSPVGIVARMCGHKFLDKGFRSPHQSYWQLRGPEDPDKNYEKQS